MRMHSHSASLFIHPCPLDLVIYMLVPPGYRVEPARVASTASASASGVRILRI
jgi:hypothetical protein